MIFWTVIWIVYGLIAFGAAILTFDEQRRTGQRHTMYNTVGYLACLLWPLPVAMILLSNAMRPT